MATKKDPPMTNSNEHNSNASVGRSGSKGFALTEENVAILKNAVLHGGRVSFRGAVLGYFLRGGIDFLLRLLRILRGKVSVVKVIKETFGASDALRTAWFFGSFSFLWKAIYDVATQLGQLTTGKAGFTAGVLAGLSIVFERKERRIGIAEQVIVRGLNVGWSILKNANRISFPFNQGDAFLFIICSAQIMFSYVRHPEVLPPTFYSFIRDTGPIPETVLKIVRGNINGEALPANTLELLQKYKPTALATESIKAVAGKAVEFVDCCIMHSHEDSCHRQGLSTFVDVFRKIFPVYGTLTLVPAIAFRFRQLLKRPVHMLQRILGSTIRSSVFLGCFVSWYMEVICLLRYFMRQGILRDGRYWYWIAGIFSSMSIFVEEKGRRTELALYTLPRAVESLYLISWGKGWVPHLPFFEVAMFSTGMGILLGAYHGSKKEMSSFVGRLITAADDFIEHPIISSAAVDDQDPGKPGSKSPALAVEVVGSGKQQRAVLAGSQAFSETSAESLGGNSSASTLSSGTNMDIASNVAASLATKLAEEIRARSADFQLLPDQGNNVTCFRYQPQVGALSMDDLQVKLLSALPPPSKVFAGPVLVKGTAAIGAVVVDCRTTDAELEAFLDAIAETGRTIGS